MKKAAIFLALVYGVLSLELSSPATEFLLREQFASWKLKYGKVYKSQNEENARYRNFIASVERVAKRKENAKNDVFGLTKFADMSVEEFKGTMLNSKQPEVDATRPIAQAKVTTTPASFDWRDYNAVTPVKNQGYCGSCWAHSAVEEIESAWYLAGNTLTEFSVEQVVQCDTTDDGCDGGWPYKAYEYVEKAGGLATATEYPYTTATSLGTTGTCDDSKVVVAGGEVTGWSYANTPCSTVECNNQDEAAMIKLLATTQPLSVVCYAESWQDYTSGVMAESDCKNSEMSLDHAIQAVGYYEYTSTGGYWIIRNSWDTDWGVDGYIYLAYGTNTCGVADQPTMVTVK